MDKKVIKQHVIPVFEVKRFFDSEYYRVYRIKEKKYENFKTRSKNDILQLKYFYEGSSFKFNEIEEKLSKIESYVAKIYDKIINIYKIGESKLKLSWSENYMLRVYFFIKLIRVKSYIDNKENLNGDQLFNKINKNKGEKEIKNEQLEDIEKLYDLFMTIKNKNEEKYSKYYKKFDDYKKSDFVFSIVNECFAFITMKETRILFFEGEDNGSISENGITQTFYDDLPMASFEYIFIHPKILIYFKLKNEFVSQLNIKSSISRNCLSLIDSKIRKNYLIRKFDENDKEITFLIPKNNEEYNIYSSFNNFYEHECFSINTDKIKFDITLMGKNTKSVSIMPLLNALSFIHSINFHLFIDEKDLIKTIDIINQKLVNRIEDRH